MFKNKILIYLKSGAIIKIRANNWIYDPATKFPYIFLGKTHRKIIIDTKEIAAFLARKWWQPWGIV